MRQYALNNWTDGIAGQQQEWRTASLPRQRNGGDRALCGDRNAAVASQQIAQVGQFLVQ